MYLDVGVFVEVNASGVELVPKFGRESLPILLNALVEACITVKPLPCRPRQPAPKVCLGITSPRETREARPRVAGAEAARALRRISAAEGATTPDVLTRLITAVPRTAHATPPADSLRVASPRLARTL